MKVLHDLITATPDNRPETPPRDGEAAPREGEAAQRGRDDPARGEAGPRGVDCSPRGDEAGARGGDRVPRGDEAGARGGDRSPRGDETGPRRGDRSPNGRPARADYLRGVRAGLPFVLPTLAIGMSFGVLAEPVMGAAAAIAMSFLVFAGAAQFASVGVLAAGGTLAAAVSAGLLINARFLPMGLAVAPSLRGGPLRRAAEGQAVVDASWALANRGDGGFDRELLLGATVPQALAWWSGTVLGVLGGSILGDPQALGLDAIFPAFYLALLAEEVRNRSALTAALLGGAIALCLVPLTPPGIPVLAAAVAALLGLRRRRRS